MTTYSNPPTQHQEGQQDRNTDRTLHAVVGVEPGTVYFLCGRTALRYYGNTGEDRMHGACPRGLPTCPHCLKLWELDEGITELLREIDGLKCVTVDAGVYDPWEAIGPTVEVKGHPYRGDTDAVEA